MNEPKQIAAALAAPFDPSEVKFKPAVVSGNRALALPYVDARVIQDRLDDALGVAGWSDEYEVLSDGSVVCRLRLKIGDEWITKTDVGGPSEQPDEGDRRKAAFSDALKRAAVKFGVGRYLYRLPSQWVDYDPHKRQFVRQPQLPASALPSKSTPAPSPAPSAAGPGRKPVADSRPPTAAPSANGFASRLTAFDAKLAAAGLCGVGECVRHVEQAAAKAKLPTDMAAWNESHKQFALSIARGFEDLRKKQKESAR